MGKTFLLAAIFSIFVGVGAAKAVECEGQIVQCSDADGRPVNFLHCDSCMAYFETNGRQAYAGICSKKPEKCTGVSCTDVNGAWVHYPHANNCTWYADSRGRIGYYGICQ